MRGCMPHARLADLRFPVSTRATTSESTRIGRCWLQRGPYAGWNLWAAHRDGRAQGRRSLNTAAAQLLLHSQATRELRARRVLAGAARSSAAPRQRPSLSERRDASWQKSGNQRNRGHWQFATAETPLFSGGRWPTTVHSQLARARHRKPRAPRSVLRPLVRNSLRVYVNVHPQSNIANVNNT